MSLFPYEPTRNLLPFDGIVNCYGPILKPCEADDYLEALLTTVPWKSDEAIICGKHIVTARKFAWYGDSSYSYTYSGTTKIALRPAGLSRHKWKHFHWKKGPSSIETLPRRGSKPSLF